jgi:carbonic anhydrase
MRNRHDTAAPTLPDRRVLLAGAAAMLGLGASGRLRPARARTPMSPDAALQALMEGHAAYQKGHVDFGDYTASRATLAAGQEPIAAVLACADSRVAPELLFNQGPGRLFVVRVAGNVENAEALASLEFGTHVLGIPLIMVLGHSACGAVAAAIKVQQENAALPGLIRLIIPAVRTAMATNPPDLLTAATVENVRGTMRDIAAAAPLIAPAVASGQVKVVGGVYDIATGAITMV